MIRSTLRSLFSLAILSSAAAVVGCSGPPVPSAISGDPVCPDYSIVAGGTKLRGGLRFPIRVTVLDDDDPVTKVIVFGKHAEGDPSPKLVLPDKNKEYKVEWSVCPNEHATAPVTATKSKSLRGEATAYDCGETKPYKTTTLTTKKGDPSSHALKFEAPEKIECWADVTANEVIDAGVADAAPVVETPDADVVADGGAADAEATDAGAVEAADAAPAKEGGDKPAEKTEKKDDKATDKPTEKKDDKPAK